ncbi:hypothetical protein [Nocardia rhamnosiphila]|uniref:Uncharacterized protein n=1 Tax=Nocardia rhamnosiphila TaxID=426716 RepID=A0ABV2WRA6_9NOCA
MWSTADPAARYLYISLATKLRYEGSEDSYEETTRIFPLTGTRTIDDLSTLNAGFGGGPDDMSQEGDQRVHSLALSLLLYLCSDRSDIQEHRPPSPAGRRGRKTRRQEGRTVVDMGFDIGPPSKVRAATAAPPIATMVPLDGHGSCASTACTLADVPDRTPEQANTGGAVAAADPGQPE